MSDGDSESKPEVDLTRLKRRVGEVIKGKWTLERLLGVGGMAAVYAAKHEIGRRDALKILHAHVAKDDEMVARFKREAKAANRFSHPGAVEVRDVDVTEDGEPFMVMELLEGGSLARRIRKDGKLAPDEVLRIATALLDVLAVAHAEGVIHRDIKPSNVFIAPDGEVKLLDFGIARIKTPGKVGRHGTLVTDVGTTLGTVAYMPPEQLRTSDVDARADLYALGATLFRALSGERTHDEDDEAKLAQAILTRDARSLADVVPDLHPRIVAIVDRALARKPAERYPDAATMKADVDAVIDGSDPSFAMGEGDDDLDADLDDGGTVKLADIDQDPTTIERAVDRAKKPTPTESENASENASETETENASESENENENENENDIDVAGGVEATVPMASDEEAPAPAGKTVIAEAPSPGLTDDGEKPGKVAKTVVDDGAEPAAKDDRGEEPPGSELGSTIAWVTAAAVVLTVAYVIYRANNDELVTPPIPMGTVANTGTAPQSSPPEPADADATSPDAGAGGDTAMQNPDDEPPKPGGSATAAPGLPVIPTIPSTLPTALPTTLPKGFPTALPPGIPTSLPKGLPTIPSSLPPIIPPAPPPPPAPAPAPSPAPAPDAP